MWRTILLGKLSISILASLIVGWICIGQPWQNEFGLLESSKWIALGVFFFLLGIGQIATIYFLMKKSS
ncbi:MAG: hypothetical protein AB8B55_19340 [Mariniblastus sp.]